MTEASGHSCVVTGATSGIGRAVALALAARGADVWMLGRSAERLGAVVAAGGGPQGELRPVVADLEREDELRAAARRILAARDRVHVLVHSAGKIAVGAFEAVSSESLDQLYRINLRAPFVLTQELLPALRRARGQIVFVNSSAGLRASASNAVYAATKHGLKAIADGLRKEVNADGIRVISVYAGRTATEMQKVVHEYEGRDYRPELLLRPEDVADVVTAALFLPASGEVTDISVRPMAKLGTG